jgi:hypothetical protein
VLGPTRTVTTTSGARGAGARWPRAAARPRR